MKTAISLPYPLFLAAEELAKRLRIPRRRLYAAAIASYVQQHGRRRVKEALDRVYGVYSKDSKLDRVLEDIQSSSLPHEKW